MCYGHINYVVMHHKSGKNGEAVKRFQEKYASEILVPADLTKGNGFVGSGTRKKINSLISQ